MPQLRDNRPGPSPIRGISNERYDWRPDTHVSEKTARSHGGNILVQQVRGLANRKDSAGLLQALRNVGMGKIDDVCIIDEDNEKFGNLLRADALCSFKRLNSWVPVGIFKVWILRGGTVIYVEDYGSTDEPAKIAVVGDGEYLQAESSAEKISIMWSSEKTPLVVLEEARAVLGDPLPGDDAAYLLIAAAAGNKAKSATAGATELIDYLRERDPEVGMIKVQYQTCELHWTAACSRIVNTKNQFAEIGLVFDKGDDHRLYDGLIRRTATSELKVNRSSVESAIGQLATHRI